MKIFTLATLALMSAAPVVAANPAVGMLIGYETTANENAQEAAAAKWFEEAYPEGVIITPSQLDKIDAKEIPAIWVHIDRLGIGAGYDIFLLNLMQRLRLSRNMWKMAAHSIFQSTPLRWCTNLAVSMRLTLPASSVTATAVRALTFGVSTHTSAQ